MADYKLDNHNAWLGLQVFPSARAEVFATTYYNRGTGSIDGFGYDAGTLTSQLPGLDYALQSSSFSGFSNLNIDRFSQIVGVNYRLTNELALSAFGEYSKYDDQDPWLYDSTGRYVNFFAGVNWLF
jgi:hypothetical protein